MAASSIREEANGGTEALKYQIYRAKFRLAEWIPWRFPVHLDLELNANCQLACVMCPYGTGSFQSDPAKQMSYETAIEALDQAKEGGAKSVKFQFRGEPGLSPILIPVVRHAKSLGFVELIINTNLTAFSDRRLRELVEAGIDKIIVSMDGATKKTYEAIRIKGNFAKLRWNLDYLIIKRKESNFKLKLQMVVQEKNRNEVEMLKSNYIDDVDEIEFQQVRDRGAGEGVTGCRKRCPQPSQRLIVMYDGQVGACCHNWGNEAIIGMFPKQTLQEIWDSNERRKLERLAQNPDKGEPCKSCTVGSSYR